MTARERLRQAKRVVVKVGTSTLTHPSGGMNLHRIERLVRELIDIANQGKDVLLVTSGAIAAGMSALRLREPTERSRTAGTRCDWTGCTAPYL